MKKLNIFLVGGAVRDKLLGFKVKERDWVVVGSKFEIMFYFKFKLVGRDFPVFLNSINKEEYALARKIFIFNTFNQKISFDFGSFVTLIDDLSNRDLIINSFALSESGYLVDLFNGMCNLKNRLLSCVSFTIFLDRLRFLRIIRFFVKYYCLGFVILPCVYVLIRYISFSDDFFSFTTERVLKEIFIVLDYNFSFLFFDILYRVGLLKIFFYELHLFFLFSSLFEFNCYMNFSLHILNLIYLLFDYTNNILLKFSVLFLKLSYGYLYFDTNFVYLKYKKISLLVLDYYKKKFFLSKKYCKFIYLLSSFYFFYNKFLFVKDFFIYFIFKRMSSYKYKIQFMNILLICFLDVKYNLMVNNFYLKYFILDILNETVNQKFHFSNKKIFNEEVYYVNFYKKIVVKYRYIYNDLYNFL